jgi:hypothetical protein
MNAMNLLGVTCAVLAALAFGVLLAYSCCQVLFALLRMHSMHARSQRSLAQSRTVDGQIQVAS